MILSGAMLLNWHGQKTGKPEFSQAAAAIEQTIANTISAGQCTRDVGARWVRVKRAQRSFPRCRRRDDVSRAAFACLRLPCPCGGAAG
ncbi:putative 3-isopropylmalate dehydrogenase [Bordetella holmesii ATCC 51541]|nr:putative 3-isopropylmalate dehydrogenase [Bordetella holmesii ATCC 51541]